MGFEAEELGLEKRQHRTLKCEIAQWFGLAIVCHGVCALCQQPFCPRLVACGEGNGVLRS
jgi:hypothetical protein